MVLKIPVRNNFKNEIISYYSYNISGYTTEYTFTKMSTTYYPMMSKSDMTQMFFNSLLQEAWAAPFVSQLEQITDPHWQDRFILETGDSNTSTVCEKLLAEYNQSHPVQKLDVNTVLDTIEQQYEKIKQMPRTEDSNHAAFFAGQDCSRMDKEWSEHPENKILKNLITTEALKPDGSEADGSEADGSEASLNNLKSDKETLIAQGKSRQAEAEWAAASADEVDDDGDVQKLYDLFHTGSVDTEYTAGGVEEGVVDDDRDVQKLYHIFHTGSVDTDCKADGVDLVNLIMQGLEDDIKEMDGDYETNMRTIRQEYMEKYMGTTESIEREHNKTDGEGGV